MYTFELFCQFMRPKSLATVRHKHISLHYHQGTDKAGVQSLVMTHSLQPIRDRMFHFCANV